MFSIENTEVHGPINAASDNPVTNEQWTKYLSKALDVRAFLPTPQFALNLILKEFGKEVTSSLRLSNKKIKNLGFIFNDTDLEAFFDQELKSFKNLQSVFQTYQYFDAPMENVFPFFADAKNLENITPELLHFKILSCSTSHIQKDTEFIYQLKIHGVPVKWKTLIEDWNPPYQFVDKQLSGPYKLWHHTHSFSKLGMGTLMKDTVIFKLPFSWPAYLVASDFVKKDVKKIFDYRRSVMAGKNFKS